MNEETGNKVVDAAGRVRRPDKRLLRLLVGSIEWKNQESSISQEAFENVVEEGAGKPTEDQSGGPPAPPESLRDQARRKISAYSEEIFDQLALRGAQGSISHTRLLLEVGEYIRARGRESAKSTDDSEATSKLPRLSELLLAERLRLEKELADLGKDNRK